MALPTKAGRRLWHEQDLRAPALLKRMLRVPPVTRVISSFNAAMLSGFVTSSMKVSMPFSSKLDTAFLVRPVANVRKPRAANSTARALPALPFEQLLWRKKILAKHGHAKGLRGQQYITP